MSQHHRIRKRTLSATDIALFFRQLATLLSAGVTFVQCCDILAARRDHPNMTVLIHSIKLALEAGNSFTSALRKHTSLFDEFSCQLLRCGELSGSLDIQLDRLACYQEKNLSLKKKLKQATFYPALVTLTAIATLLILLIVIVPRFEELFANSSVPLPILTRIVIRASALLRDPFSLLILFPLLGLLYTLSQKTTRHAIYTYLTDTRLMGPVLQKIMLARFMRALATLLAAGMPILDALQMTSRLYTFPVFVTALTKLQININAGRQLHAAMSTDPLFPSHLIQLVKVGEESGTLDCMLDKVADFYESDIDCLINKLTHTIEPLIIMLLGVLIGGLVIAMYLPIFQLGTVI